MTPLTDDELGDLLTETFAMHEELADPERAVAIAVAPRRPAHRGRVLLGAATAVALMAVGTTYVVTQVDGGRDGTVKLGPPSAQAGSAEAVTRANRVFAERLADQALEGLRARAGQLPEGSREVRADDVPALTKLMSFIGPGVGHDFTRSAFFEAPGDAATVAGWFAAHPPAGTTSDGGPTGVGGSRNPDGSWSDEVTFDYATGPEVSAHASLASLVQVTPQGSGVGIRVTVFGSYRPGRPAASYARDVTAVQIRVTDWVMGRHGGQPRVHHRSFELTHSQLGHVVTRFNALPGGAPMGMRCLGPLATRTYRLTFETGSGVLSVVGTTGCGSALTVHRDGRVVPPSVDGADFYGFLDRELSLPSLPSR